MPARVKVLSQDFQDIVQRYRGEISDTKRNDSEYSNKTVDANSVFRDVWELKRESCLEEAAIFYKRGYIKFTVPVINQYLAGDKISVMRLMLEYNGDTEVAEFLKDRTARNKLLNGEYFFSRMFLFA